jgi:hypothetical protein
MIIVLLLFSGNEENMADLIVTNKMRWHRRYVLNKRKTKKFNKLFLQQWWASPFVDGDKGKWIDVPVEGKIVEEEIS